MFRSYLKIALRVLIRRKFFAFISLFGISFTLATLMVFVALLDHSLGPLEPEVNRDRTLLLDRISMTGPNRVYNTTAGYGLLDLYLRDLAGVEMFSIVSGSPDRVASYSEGKKVKLLLRRTDGKFWEVMRFDFVEGGPFSVEDDDLGRNVAVLSESTRRKLFGDSLAVGRSLKLDGQVLRIVGIVKDVPIYRVVPFGEVWVPIGSSKTEGYRSKLAGGFSGLFVLKPGASPAVVRQEVRDRLQRIEIPDPGFERIEVEMVSSVGSIARQIGLDTPGLFAAVILVIALFMVLPAINLVNVSVSRIMERSSEVGIRKAFGAGRGVLVGQFVFENLILTLLGGIVGLLVAGCILEVVERSNLIPYAVFNLNWRVFSYSLLLTILFGVLSGAYPAWRMSKMDPVEALRGANR